MHDRVALDLRRIHQLLRRPDAGAQRPAYPCAISARPGQDHHRCIARAEPLAPKRGAKLVRRLDEVLPPRREHAQCGGQLLRQGCTGGVLPRPADPSRDARQTFARRCDATFVAHARARFLSGPGSRTRGRRLRAGGFGGHGRGSATGDRRFRVFDQAVAIGGSPRICGLLTDGCARKRSARPRPQDQNRRWRPSGGHRL